MKLSQIPAGRIVNAHGVRGEVRVLPDEVELSLFPRLTLFYLDGAAMVPQSVRVHKGAALVKFPGVDTMDAALSLKGKRLLIDRDAAPPPSGGYFDSEFLGLEVFDGATGKPMGKVTAVDHYPASRVLTVKGEKTFLIPAVPEAFLLSVNLEENRMEVRRWEGLATDE